MKDDFKVRRANIFAKLLYIFVKDFKLLVRSKVSALVFFLGPIIITLMVSIAFNTSSLYSINVAAFSEAYSPMSESLIANLSGGNYAIVKVSSLEECVDSVKFDDFQVCVEFGPNMVPSNSATNNVKLYVDNSRVNLANQLIDYMNSKLNVQSTEVSSSLVRQLIDILDLTNKEIAQRDVTVKKLSETNQGGISKLEVVVGQLNSLDFSPVSYNKTAITDSLSIISAKNVSVAGLNSSVLSLMSSYDSITAKLDNARSKTGESGSAVNEVMNLLIEDKDRITLLSGSIGVISAGIGSVKVTNIESIVKPIRTSIEPLSRTSNYLAYIFPVLVAVIVMFISILMSSSAVIQERKSNAYFRNSIAPTSEFLLLFGRYMTLLLVIAAEISLVLFLGSLFLNGTPLGSYVAVGLVLLLEASIFIFLGMFIGYLFETVDSVAIAAISLATSCLFLSNVVLPVELMSGVLRQIVRYNPFVITEGIIKKIILFNSTLGSFYVPLMILAGFALLFFVLSVVMWVLDTYLEA